MVIKSASRSLPHGYEHRKAHASDQTHIQNLVHQVLREYGLVPEPDGVDADLQDLAAHYGGGYFGVIEHNQNIVATFGLAPLDEETMEIRKMYSLPHVRGKGLGKWMVGYLLEIAKNNGYKHVELETASPLKEAIGLYEYMGFCEKKFENKTPRCDKSFVISL